MTKNTILADSLRSNGGEMAGSSYDSQNSLQIKAHSGGPISINPPSPFTAAAGSPLVGASGTPPSFDTWMKVDKAPPHPSSLGTSAHTGSPVISTSYVLAQDSFTASESTQLAGSKNSQTLSDSGSTCTHTSYSGQNTYMSEGTTDYKVSASDLMSSQATPVTILRWIL